MKPTLHTVSKASFKFLIAASLLINFSSAQTGPGGGSGNGSGNSMQLSFDNYINEPGSPAPGTNGATYRFKNVNNKLDALVKIKDRSHSAVSLTQLDVTSTGWNKAFQPQISYNNGNVPSAMSYWMEFEITFVDKGTSTPVTVNTFDVSALDIDGNGNRLSETQSFFNLTSYTTETGSYLTISNLLQSILGILTPVGKTFTGSQTDYAGIDTNATRVMTSIKYNNVNTIKFRVGATTTGSVSDATRMYSTWFKDFNYTQPMISTLPVELTSFTAMLINNTNKVNLNWTSASEINVNYFAIEKSTDGKNFSDAGVVMAAGNTSEEMKYSFVDNVNTNQTSVIYYRLRMVDFDGTTEYSATRIIRTGKSNDNGVTILTYPNPVTSEVRITIPNSWQGKKVTYEILNANGQAARKTEVANANQTETLNVSNLAPGVYIVKVSSNGLSAIQKIVKQ